MLTHRLLVQGTLLIVFALTTIIAKPLLVHADDMDFGPYDAEALKDKTAPADSISNNLAPELESNSAVSNSVVDPTTGAIKSSVNKKSKWSEIRRNFGAGFFQYATGDASEINRSKGKLETYNYVSLEYRTGRGEKVFVRPAFLFQTEGEDLRGRIQESKFTTSDLYLGFSSYNIPWMPFEMDYKTEVRLYLPTSDSSINEGMIARLRGDLKAHYPLMNRLTFLLWFKPDYYFQRRTAKLTSRGFANGTRDYGYELSANLYYQMRGGIFGFGGGVQHEQSWTHDSVLENVSVFRREDISAQVYLGINAYGFLMHIGVDQAHDVARPRGPIVAFNDVETQYFARTYYRF